MTDFNINIPLVRQAITDITTNATTVWNSYYQTALPAYNTLLTLNSADQTLAHCADAKAVIDDMQKAVQDIHTFTSTLAAVADFLEYNTDAYTVEAQNLQILNTGNSKPTSDHTWVQAGVYGVMITNQDEANHLLTLLQAQLFSLGDNIQVKQDNSTQTEINAGGKADGNIGKATVSADGSVKIVLTDSTERSGGTQAQSDLGDAYGSMREMVDILNNYKPGQQVIVTVQELQQDNDSAMKAVVITVTTVDQDGHMATAAKSIVKTQQGSFWTKDNSRTTLAINTLKNFAQPQDQYLYQTLGGPANINVCVPVSIGNN